MIEPIWTGLSWRARRMREPLFRGKTPSEEFDEFVSEVNKAVNEVARRYDLGLVSGGATHDICSGKLSYTLKIERLLRFS